MTKSKQVDKPLNPVKIANEIPVDTNTKGIWTQFSFADFVLLSRSLTCDIFWMKTLKSANKELKGMMKTVKLQDIDNLQDVMIDMMDISSEIQESLGRSYCVPDDIDEDDLLGEIDALEADIGRETECEDVPSYLQSNNEPDLNEQFNLPSAPSGYAVPTGRVNNELHCSPLNP
ncbi:vacuolar protein sorting-associated protein 60.2 [Lactuca sativa]|uniref:vacuolar protein sorting-associated protein 60.2 n=1 Tax=Lactuca sativa TaxID=4236 RepID=UPI0022B0277B|nr:vacuolar protein sorting-associated protein 60.2 [Lactuca sativa]